MKVTVTGGCGFIGSNLVESLCTEGNSVKVFDNLQTGNLENIKGLDVEFFNKPYSKLFELAPETDLIFHLGIPSSSPIYKEQPRIWGKSIGDAIEIFEYAKTQDCKVIYASSSSIYNGNEVPFREDMKVHVTDYYTECRYGIERVANLYSKLHGVKNVGLRFFSVYGPKEKYKKQFANIVSQFLWLMKEDKVPEIYGDGTQTRDFIYVGDVVKALLLASKKDFDCEIFNVGTGVSHSFNQVIQILNDMMVKNVEPSYRIPNPIKNYVQDTLADVAKSENLLGFRSEITLEQGIKRLLLEST